LPVADQLDELGRMLGASGALPVGQHIANLLRVYQANLEAIVDYQPFPSDLPVTLIKAAGGFPQVMRPGREVHSFTDAPLHGWEYLGLPNFRVVEVPGDHFTVFSAAHLGALAAAVRDCLNRT
jgi:thioesterase domain-containing protein